MSTASLRFKESLAKVPQDIKTEVDLSFAIANRIDRILKERNLTQKEFAHSVEKTETEVSRWLSGTHNFTLRTIAKISASLGVDILYVI